MATKIVPQPEQTTVQRIAARVSASNVRHGVLLAIAGVIATLAPTPLDAVAVGSIVTLAWDLGKRR